MKFNKQQEEAIKTIAGNIAVIAAAGSGKTSVLTYRIKNMIENHNISPSSILAITFSKKAKNNIINKLEKLNIKNVNVETFHSFALKIISSEYGINYFKIWTAQWEKDKCIKDICLSLNLCSEQDIPFNEIYSFIALQKHNMKTPDEELIYPIDLLFSKKDMKNIYKLYENYKQKHLYIEFDDFLNIANNVLDNNKILLDKYKSLCQYVLVDEFQDVSISQALLLQKINSNNTMIVGDPLQAIYSFRGGNSKFILNFDKNYPNAKIINLNVNYRCSQDIVKAANELASYISDSKHKYYKESVAKNGNYKIPEVRNFVDEYEESKWISNYIQQIKNNGNNYNDIAILARTNAQLQKFEMELHKNIIPFEVVDGQLFTDLPEIKLILSYFKLALHENDNSAFNYLYNKPNRWLDKKFLEEVKTNSVKRNVSFYHSMLTIDRRNWKFKNGIDEILEVVNYLQNKKPSSVAELVKYLRNRLHIDEYISKGKKSDDGNYVEQIENIDSFENMCLKYKTIEELIQYMDELNKEVQKQKTDAVQLLTIHRAKGMEYPIVFVVGCNNELLPHYKNVDIEDEWKLFYVAITRAEKELYLSYTDTYNNKTYDVSPFILSIKDIISVISEDEMENINIKDKKERKMRDIKINLKQQREC